MERYALADAKWAGEQIELFKKEVKNSTVKIIKGTSHGTIFFNPEVAILIREFLK